MEGGKREKIIDLCPINGRKCFHIDPHADHDEAESVQGTCMKLYMHTQYSTGINLRWKYTHKVKIYSF